MTIHRVKQINNPAIYRRERGHETWIPLYSVMSPDGRTLEEFERLASAERWCRQTKDFVIAAVRTRMDVMEKVPCGL